jgi:prepilin-type N-terminal cleavage/methylation domain-containing protein
MRKQKGFSLIELLVVVAIILVLAAMGIPSLLRARIASNEASAVSSMRTINTAQVTYASTYPTVGYASVISILGPGTGGGSASSSYSQLLDNVLGCSSTICTKSGYTFSISASGSSPVGSYSSTAAPLTLQTTGNRYFYSDSTGVIRYNASAIAVSGDAPIQ